MRKPFDYRKAQAGAKVVTRDGRTVRIVAYDMDCRFPICAIIRSQEGTEYPEVYLKDGRYDEDGIENNCDLFIEEEYRPYANADEMDEAIKVHGMFVKHRNGKRLAITGYDDNDTSVGDGCTYGALLEYFTWFDGTPCGVQEGGEDE